MPSENLKLHASCATGSRVTFQSQLLLVHWLHRARMWLASILQQACSRQADKREWPTATCKDHDDSHTWLCKLLQREPLPPSRHGHLEKAIMVHPCHKVKLVLGILPRRRGHIKYLLALPTPLRIFNTHSFGHLDTTCDQAQARMVEKRSLKTSQAAIKARLPDV